MDRSQRKSAWEKSLQGEMSSSASEWTKCRANVVHERIALSEDMRLWFMASAVYLYYCQYASVE